MKWPIIVLTTTSLFIPTGYRSKFWWQQRFNIFTDINFSQSLSATISSSPYYWEYKPFHNFNNKHFSEHFDFNIHSLESSRSLTWIVCFVFGLCIIWWWSQIYCSIFTLNSDFTSAPRPDLDIMLDQSFLSVPSKFHSFFVLFI